MVGNFLLSRKKDGSPQLGLIDFGKFSDMLSIYLLVLSRLSTNHIQISHCFCTCLGQVKTLTKEQRHLFCKIIIALADENKELVVNLMKDAGFQSKYMDPNVIYLYAKVCYDEDNKELTNGKHIQLFMEDIQNMDPIIHLPSTSVSNIL
jgi:hypothetical protein